MVTGSAHEQLDVDARSQLLSHQGIEVELHSDRLDHFARFVSYSPGLEV
jgi:hypothetical protein